MKVNFKFEDKDIKVNFENNYRLKEQTTEKGIKVLMLKGEKGDPGIGGAEWGGITGTLSKQTDLQNVLNKKANNTDIPTKTSELENDSGFLTQHQDLTNYAKKEDIPDVSNFITNSVNDLTNYTLTTNTGSQIELNINSSDFKMTAILKDINGNIVCTSNVIDLPLETMVVGASYNNNTKEVILTLQNGTTTRFSVADLVDGLINQTQLEAVTGSLSDLQTINKNNLVSAINELSNSNIIDIIYPVGSIYISKNSVSPSTLFGGTWSQIKDSYLVCAGDTYTAGVTGGSRTKTLAVENLPSHTHSLNSHTHTYNKVKSPTGGTELTESQIPHSFWHANRNAAMDTIAAAFSGGADYAIVSNPNSTKGTSHNHTVSTESKNTGASSGNTGNTGSGTAFNIDPPYIPVYVWERTS